MPKTILCACAAAVLSLAASTRAAETQAVDAGGVKFQVQTIDKSLKVGYAVRVANMNADDKPDVVVCDADRVIWFENPSWKLHTILESKAAGIKTDNVC